MNTLVASLGVEMTITLLGVMVLLLSLLVFLVPDFKTFMRSQDMQLNDAYLDKYPSVCALKRFVALRISQTE
jgi:hypothetical protein